MTKSTLEAAATEKLKLLEAAATEKLKPPDEAATYLGIKEQTLAVWRSSGRYGLPFVRVGRAIRYRESDLKSWIEQRTATSVVAAK